MIGILFPLGIFLVWLVWIPVAMLERAARRDPSGFSFVPVIPIVPLVAWGVAVALDLLHEQLGLWVIGGLHVVLLLSLLVSAFRSMRIIQRLRRECGASE